MRAVSVKAGGGSIPCSGESGVRYTGYSDPAGCAKGIRVQQILVLEDMAETRAWLVRTVAECFPGSTVAEAARLSDALSLVERQAFDLALVDLNLPDGDGFALLRRLSQTRPETLGIVTTIMASDAAIVAALSAGASGYLLKSDPPEMFARQLRLIASGAPALSPAIARRIMAHFRQTGPNHGGDHTLTPREQEVLSLIARGLRTGEVATNLGCANSTVATHVKSIYRKLGVSSRAEAATEASRLGLL